MIVRESTTVTCTAAAPPMVTEAADEKLVPPNAVPLEGVTRRTWGAVAEGPVDEPPHATTRGSQHAPAHARHARRCLTAIGSRSSTLRHPPHLYRLGLRSLTFWGSTTWLPAPDRPID